MDTKPLPWDVTEVFKLPVTVTPTDCDRFGHTNNTVYLRWLERVAWAHSENLGMSFERYEALGAGCVVHRHELDYLAATFAGDELVLGTWVAENDGRIGLWRAYQIIRPRDARSVLRGRTHFVCIDLKSGRPRRQPPEFVTAYRPAHPAS
ncbi:MAG TPA: thioesterase family protein [Nevskiaceae bacterium]|nr:thioesterase family protein [Nevskiaceae bacterium]